ncbi:MAG: endo-1,4-beta-xylanase, partial [Planctomycetales bacterium]|nr:endo-1,4-beta-xylanase [Planctomycetales bacterium]
MGEQFNLRQQASVFAVLRGQPGRIARISVWAVALCAGITRPVWRAQALLHAGEIVMSDFSDTGFDWQFGGFTQTLGAGQIRLQDMSDGWGGAGAAVGLLDLSGLAEGRWVIDLTPEAANRVDGFALELYDDSPTPRSGKWPLTLSSLTPGAPATLVSSDVLGRPQSGVGDYANLDLSRISSWQILGEWQSAGPFDVSFDRVAISDEIAPPPPYAGAELDAAWRAEATTRIDAIRKSDLEVHVVDALGNPIRDAVVDVHMQRHAFGFGSAVTAVRLRDDDPQYAEYKSKIAELFNVATIENNLKWEPWEGEWGAAFTQEGAVAAIDWLTSRKIDVRRHVLVWPGAGYLPQDIEQMIADGTLTEQEQVDMRRRIAERIASVAAATEGGISSWDVINETRANHVLMDLLSE